MCYYDTLASLFLGLEDDNSLCVCFLIDDCRQLAEQQRARGHGLSQTQSQQL